MAQRPRMTRDDVVRAAVALLDRAGLEGLSVRAVARELGVPAMTLYTYVRNKEDLFDAVTGAVLRLVPLPAIGDPRPWRELCVEVWTAYRGVLMAHPHAARLALRRTRSGDLRERDSYEVSTALLMRAGLAPLQALDAHRALNGFVVGSVLNQTALPYDASGNVVEPAPADDDHPHYAAVRPGLASPDFDAAFSFGLTLLLDGIEAAARRA